MLNYRHHVTALAVAGAMATVTTLSSCAAGTDTATVPAGAEALSITAEAVARNANGIAAGRPVTQTDLDLSIEEVAAAGFADLGYTFGDRGSGESPAVTISWESNGISCTTRIAKSAPGENKVTVVEGTTCQ